MTLQHFLLLICAATIQGVSSQLTTNCPSGSFPVGLCSCNLGNVECRNIVSWPTYTNEVVLNKLVIRRSPRFQLGNSTFKNLKLVRLELPYNDLDESRVEFAAFDGLTVSDLDLSNNNFTSIPRGLIRIKNLQGLDISSNDITSFAGSSDTMKRLGSSLSRFSFGSAEILSWPIELRYFPVLQELNVTAANFTLIPMTAFYGFERSLRKLLIEHTNLQSVPLAIGQLDYLTDLKFDHNRNVGDYGMNIPLVADRLTHLGLMSLKDDAITTFPRVIGTLRNLSKVIMDDNALDFVSDESANTVKGVKSLSLKNSGMTRIPGALQHIKSLESLDISHNEIHSVQGRDLMELTNLQTLKLNDNPILSIASDAFDSLGQLSVVELRNTNLTEVPCAFKNLRLDNLTALVDLTGNKIECTCDLRWFIEWRKSFHDGASKIKVLGDCYTIYSSLEDYFKTMDTCPVSFLCSI